MFDRYQERHEEAQTALWLGKLGLGGIWTAVCGGSFLFLVASMASDRPAVSNEGEEAALGMATCMAAGCTGACWLSGLVVLMVLYAFVRR